MAVDIDRKSVRLRERTTSAIAFGNMDLEGWSREIGGHSRFRHRQCGLLRRQHRPLPGQSRIHQSLRSTDPTGQPATRKKGTPTYGEIAARPVLAVVADATP